MAAGSIGGAAIGAHAAGKASDAQSQAAMYAADLQKKAADEALAFQKQEYADQQKNLAPWIKAGQGAVTSLSSMLAPGGTLSQGWMGQFQAPTNVTEQNDPGFQFRLQQGQQALERSAAARGNLLTGGTAKALTQYGQDYASNEYGNVYNRALNDYQLAYNQFQQNQANQYNRYAGLAGLGQTTAGTLAQAGQATAGNVGNILLGSANSQANEINNAAAARASGYVGGANAWGGALQGGANALSSGLLMNLLGQKYGGGGSASPLQFYGA